VIEARLILLDPYGVPVTVERVALPSPIWIYRVPIPTPTAFGNREPATAPSIKVLEYHRATKRNADGSFDYIARVGREVWL
jgi:hypothetical protein